MTRRPELGSLRRLGSALRTEWTELSGLGRTALIGVALSAILALTLGFLIPNAARTHLLDARAESIEQIATDLSRRGLVPLGDEAWSEEFDEAVRLRLLGGDTVRVKVWSPDGTIVYSDARALIGQSFELDEEAAAALGGKTGASIADPAGDENVFEQGFGDLIEFYVPVRDSSGTVVGLFEVYQRADSLRESLDNIRFIVWLSIGIGLGVLSVAMASLTIATARGINRRRRQAEDLLSALMRAQDDERARVVGALHDDIGQPIYRVLYALQMARDHVAPGSHGEQELDRAEQLLREVDHSLRTELTTLRHGLTEEVDLETALNQLSVAMESESKLSVEVQVSGTPDELAPAARRALFRAAQEGLMNVRKHSQARRATMRLDGGGDVVTLEVADAGRGWAGNEGLGLATTRERLEAIGGGLDMISRKPAGTTLVAWVPVSVRGDRE